MKNLKAFKISPLFAMLMILAVGVSGVAAALLWVSSVQHTIEVTGIKANLFDPGLYSNFANNVSATNLVDSYSLFEWTSSWVMTTQDLPSIAVTVTEEYLATATLISVSIPDLPTDVSCSMEAYYVFYATNGGTELYKVASPVIAMDLDTSYVVDPAAMTWDSYVPPSGSGGYDTCIALLIEFTFTSGPGADLGSHLMNIEVSLMDAA